MSYVDYTTCVNLVQNFRYLHFQPLHDEGAEEGTVMQRWDAFEEQFRVQLQVFQPVVSTSPPICLHPKLWTAKLNIERLQDVKRKVAMQADVVNSVAKFVPRGLLDLSLILMQNSANTGLHYARELLRVLQDRLADFPADIVLTVSI